MNEAPRPAETPPSRAGTGPAAPAIEIAVSVACADWARAVDDVEGVCRRAALAALEVVGMGMGRGVEISVLLADDAVLRDLNARYRGRDRPTNVLAFANLEPPSRGACCGAMNGPALLGDVAVSFRSADTEAAAAAKPLADHLSHLVVHGTLHLLGYDHAADDEAEVMTGLEAEALARLGIADPYAETEVETISGP